MVTKKHRTAQRSAIMEYLKDNKSHPSVMEIYQYVSQKLSTLSITTVYNTMELLKTEGLVSELPMLHGEGRRYDSNIKPHDHLHCSGCGTVVDIEVDVDHSLMLTEKQQHGFDIKDICINVYGLCPECKNENIMPV